MNKWFAGCDNVKLFELHKNVKDSGVRKLAIQTACRLQGSVMEDSVRHKVHAGLQEIITVCLVNIPKLSSLVIHLFVFITGGKLNMANGQ